MTAPHTAELELRAVLDAAVDAIVIIDGRGQIEGFNRAAEQLFGYTAREAIGRNVRTLMPEPYRSAHDGYLEHYHRTGERRIIGIGREAVAQRQDGSTFPISLAVGQIQALPEPRYVGFIHDISERVRQAAEVRHSRDRAQSYLDLAGVILLALDSEGRVTLLNRQGEAILGWNAKNLVGRDWASTCLPEELREQARERLRASLEGQGPGTTIEEYEVLNRQGGRRLVAWRHVVLRDPQGTPTGLLSSGEDVTEQRAAQTALAKSEQLLRQAQALAGLANYEAQLPDGEIFWSEEMYRILGREPALGPPNLAEFLDNYVDPVDRDRFERRWSEVSAQGGNFDLEFRVQAGDGRQRFVHAAALVVREAEGRIRVSGTLHDITERQRIAEEMRQAQERLTQFARLSTMGEMAAGLAHEINQPLTAITTFSQALTRLMTRPDGPDAAEIKEVLDQIAAQALRAGDVIRRLRSFVKNREVQQEQFDITDLVEETLIFAEPDARLSSIRLRLEADPGLPPVNCDRVQIQQVLLNLLRNAVDATNDAGPALREVVVATRLLANGEIEVSVSDHGPGISPLVAENLGHPFFTTKASGTGLGIAISRSILRAHGGQFGHRLTPGGGATVFFTLPTEAMGAP